jgi:hypothetical protein
VCFLQGLWFGTCAISCVEFSQSKLVKKHRIASWSFK